MKRIFCLLICILMLVSLALPVFAKDDAAVNYQLGLRASAPKKGDSYSEGETVKITVFVRDILESAPDIYGIGGTLNYDAYLLTFKSVSFATGFSGGSHNNNTVEGTVSLSFLCSTKNGELAGKKVSAEFDFCTISFTAKKSGTARTFLSDFIITNKDATERLISSSDAGVDIKIGDGKTVISKELLENAITDAKKDLAKAHLGTAEKLTYPAFAVSQQAFDAYSEAIGNAENALDSATKTSEIEAAIRALSTASEAFEDAKVFGKRTGGTEAPGTSKDDSDDLIEVVATANPNGKLQAGSEKQLARKGTSVSIITVPDEGFEVEKFVINGVEYVTSSNVYTIESVTHATKVEVFFIKKPRFTDVPRGTWFFDSVEKIAEIGLFAGTSETKFSPDAEMTRAMLVTVLHRLEGTPKVENAATFRDVASGQWYSDAVAWASESGLVKGYTENTFGTDDSITRQDMVTILYRYLQYKGMTPDGAKEIADFTDAGEVSAYALDAVQWSYGTGLVKGTSERALSPRANTTRAQVATIILRYIENISE